MRRRHHRSIRTLWVSSMLCCSLWHWCNATLSFEASGAWGYGRSFVEDRRCCCCYCCCCCCCHAHKDMCEGHESVPLSTLVVAAVKVTGNMVLNVEYRVVAQVVVRTVSPAEFRRTGCWRAELCQGRFLFGTCLVETDNGEVINLTLSFTSDLLLLSWWFCRVGRLILSSFCPPSAVLSYTTDWWWILVVLCSCIGTGCSCGLRRSDDGGVTRPAMPRSFSWWDASPHRQNELLEVAVSVVIITLFTHLYSRHYCKYKNKVTQIYTRARTSISFHKYDWLIVVAVVMLKWVAWLWLLTGLAGPGNKEAAAPSRHSTTADTLLMASVA